MLCFLSVPELEIFAIIFTIIIHVKGQLKVNVTVSYMCVNERMVCKRKVIVSISTIRKVLKTSLFWEPP